MKSARTRLSALALLVAIIGTTTAPAFAARLHPICAAKQHDCGKTPTITKCCCGDEQASQTNGAPAQSRVEVRADLSLMPVATCPLQATTRPRARWRVHTSPPHLHLLDLPTLFAALLI